MYGFVTPMAGALEGWPGFVGAAPRPMVRTQPPMSGALEGWPGFVHGIGAAAIVSATARLQVIDKNGRPFPGIPVSMQWMESGTIQTGEATTDKDGVAQVRASATLRGALVVAFVHVPESTEPLKVSTNFDEPQVLIVRSASAAPGLPWATVALAAGGVAALGLGAWLLLRKPQPAQKSASALAGRRVRRPKPVLHVPPHVHRGWRGMYELWRHRESPALTLRKRT
jgi:hypothetical protein